MTLFYLYLPSLNFFCPSDFWAISTILSKETFNKPEDRKVLPGLAPFSSSSRKASVRVVAIFDGSLWQKNKIKSTNFASNGSVFLGFLDLWMSQQIPLATLINPGAAPLLGRSTLFCFFKYHFLTDLVPFFPSYYSFKILVNSIPTRIFPANTFHT